MANNSPATSEIRKSCYVIGHRNPDTDAICSAIGYADFLRRTRIPSAKAMCCGLMNARTEWVLKEAGVEAPPVIMDVRPTAGSICRREVVTASPHETFFDVYTRMREFGLRGLPVVDDAHRIRGLIQIADLLELVLPATVGAESARRVETSVVNIAQVLDADILVTGRDAVVEGELIMAVGGSTKELMEERIEGFHRDKLIVIVGNRTEIQKLAIDRGVRAIVLTGGASLNAELTASAKATGINVMSTARDTGSTVQLIRCSRKVATAIQEDILKFSSTAPVSEMRYLVQPSNQVIFPVVDPETERLVGVLSKSDLVDVPLQRLVLVDHNEFSQAVPGADEAEILEVIDHHRLSGNLVSKEPVRFINECVGSTSTIVAVSYRDFGIDPPQGIAMCLMAGIISDTLKLTSPTTTDIDRDVLTWLSTQARVDIDEFSTNFFAEGSVLREKTPAEAISMDRKEYEEAGWKISISQIEELGLELFWELHEVIDAELAILVEDPNIDFACVMVTDITKHYSVLLTEGAQEIIDAITYPELESGAFEMRGVVSRKKQLFPELSRLLSKIPKPAGV